jgi:sporulation protein YlmC with PRC-barrel domain
VIFLVSANLITGKKVVATNGDAIGEVKDADFDTTTWKINSLLLRLTDKAASELGYTRPSGSLGSFSMNRGSKSVFMPVDLVNSIGDVVTIKKSLIELEEGKYLKRYSE